VSLILTFSLALAAWLLSPSPLRAQDRADEPIPGKTLYEWHCARCHGTSGWGDGPQARELLIPPANFHSAIARRSTDEEMLMRIEFGVVMSPMHSWRGRLTEQEMQDLVAYIRSLAQRSR
jgi:mono/diheme cytochrome c family protein